MPGLPRFFLKGQTLASIGPAVLLFLLAGCSTLVVPPSAPVDGRSVFLLEHGQHASLVLPGKAAGVVRYSYGDWNYYAIGDKGISSGLRALQGPTLAGLGRRELAAALTEEGVRGAVKIPIAAAHELQVAAGAIEILRAQLDGIYLANIDSLLYNPEIDLEFVHHPTPYSSEHNSNRVVADWLEILGCKVSGPTFVPNWKIRRALSSDLPPATPHDAPAVGHGFGNILLVQREQRRIPADWC